jgi:hypothetical protein
MKKDTLKSKFKDEGLKALNYILSFKNKGVIYKIDWNITADFKNSGSLQNIIYNKLNYKR